MPLIGPLVWGASQRQDHLSGAQHMNNACLPPLPLPLPSRPASINVQEPKATIHCSSPHVLGRTMWSCPLDLGRA